MYHKWKSYDVCFLRYEAWQKDLLSFWAIFCAFTPLTTPKNQNFEKMKYKPGNIIILNKSTKKYDHMLYPSWDMVHDGCNFHFLFSAAFCPFKATGGDTILPVCTKNYDHILYCSWDIALEGFNFHFLFWAAFYPFKAPEDFTHVYQKLRSDVWFLRYWLMDRLMDEQRSDI